MGSDRTFVYIDGFSLYHRVLRGRPGRRWLNLARFPHELLPSTRIEKVRYFTARVQDFGEGAHQRQDVYLRALRTLPVVDIHLGAFHLEVRRRKLVSPEPGASPFVEVWEPREKGSDMSLAANLVLNGACGRYDTALVITNDSNLAEPIRLVTSELRKEVVLAYPARVAARSLVAAGPTRILKVRVSTILKSQFEPALTDRDGRPILKPPGW